MDRIDINKWRNHFGAMTPDAAGHWSVQGIYGPADACRLLAIRDLIIDSVKFGDGAPADLFLLSTGEAPLRDSTKIGGLPYFDRSAAWPLGSSGRPLPFLAQFNFCDSIDIVNDLPADILLVFAHPDCHDGVGLEWQDSGRHVDLVTSHEIPVASNIPSFYGSAWRTENFPDGKPNNDQWSEIELPSGESVLNVYLVLRTCSMQIGAYPFIPQPVHPKMMSERILCSLSSICPIAGVPYPFLNHPDHLSDSECESLYVNITSDVNDGFGTMYVTIDGNNGLRWYLRNL